MKFIIDFTKLEFSDNLFLLYKKVLNISKFTEKNIKKQLGLNLLKVNNIASFEITKNKFYRKFFLKFFSYLIINKIFYLKMQKYFNKLQKNTMIVKNIRLNKGLPVNGQRTKTNSRNSRKKYFLKYNQHIIN